MLMYVAGLARVSKHVTLPTLQKQLVPPSMSNCGGNGDRGPGSFLQIDARWLRSPCPEYDHLDVKDLED